MWTTRTNRILAACDSFKGTLPSFKVGEAIEAGYHRFSEEVCPTGARPHFTHCPMSDGGAGLLHSLTYEAGRAASTKESAERPLSSAALTLQRVFIPESVPITGPLGSPLTDVSFACDVHKGVIVVEMAEASGLPRIHDPRQRNPLRTTSYGTGEVIRYALEYFRHAAPECAQRGVELYLGIGGSATNDGGLGALQALGLDIFVQTGASGTSSGESRLTQPFRGADLARLTHVGVSEAMHGLFFNTDASAPVRVKKVYLICDVDNPLVGPRGATYTFGPQKCSPATASQPGGNGDVEDTAVGEVRGEAQKQILDQLEAGMVHAAAQTAVSLWSHVEQQHQQQPQQSPPQRMAGTSHAVPKTVEEHQHALLHAPGGGGAGGMSGFFRFVLGATFLPGADAVAELLNLRIPTTHTRNTDSAEPTHSSTTGLPFTGLLYSMCDILATGEGSFDSQTVYSHKTVGRLLEMAVEANLYHQQRRQTDEKLVKGVLVLCGRCGFSTPEACQSEIEAALVTTLLPTLTSANATARAHTPLETCVVAQLQQSDKPRSAAAAVVKNAIPEIYVLALSPQRFSVKEAMTQPYQCVQEAVYQFLKASVDHAADQGDGSARAGKPFFPQRPSSL